MSELARVSPEVLANVRARWPERADRWAGHLNDEVADLCRAYDAKPREVLPARYGFVVAADSPHGPLVLRSSPDPHGVDQAAVATALAQLGVAPTVHQTLTSDHGTWTVQDRVTPGTPLAAVNHATTDLEALFAPLAALNGQPTPRPGMVSIIDWLHDRLNDDRLTDLRPGTIIAPAGQRRAALDVLDYLAQDYRPGLCHGDASLRNVLASADGRWLLIDPRGVAGEAAYDAAVLASRVAHQLGTTDIIPTIAELTDLPTERILGWMTVADTARV